MGRREKSHSRVCSSTALNPLSTREKTEPWEPTDSSVSPTDLSKNSPRSDPPSSSTSRPSLTALASLLPTAPSSPRELSTTPDETQIQNSQGCPPRRPQRHRRSFQCCRTS